MNGVCLSFVEVDDFDLASSGMGWDRYSVATGALLLSLRPYLLQLPERRYASAVLAMALCPSGCVCHKSAFYRNGWTDRAGFCRGSFIHSFIRFTVSKRSSDIYRNKVYTHLWNFLSQTRGLRKFCCGISIVEMCYRLKSTRWPLRA